MIYFKVRAENYIDKQKVRKIAEDCGVSILPSSDHWADQLIVECYSSDDVTTMRQIYRELGYQTQRIHN